jgi:hypothetical protein
VRSACFPAAVTLRQSEVEGGESGEGAVRVDFPALCYSFITARSPSAVTSRHMARSREVTAQCSQPLVRQHAPFVALVLQRHHRREPQHQHASSVVSHLSTSRFTAHRARPSIQRTPTAPPLRLQRTQSLRLGPSSRLQHLQQLRPPASVIVSRRRCARSIAEIGMERQPPCVSSPPSARDGEGARTPHCLRCVVGVSRRRVEGRHRLIECGATTTRRSPPCCCQLCTLWH